MKVVLLITVTFTLALGLNNQPCQENKKNNAYNKFVRKHILKESFDRQSRSAWKEYIKKKRLCHRGVQSFFEKSDQGKVEQICNGYGRQLLHGRNFCISDHAIPGYYINNRSNCKVTQLKYIETNVIVACDEVVKHCLPVHIVGHRNQIPYPAAARCQPA